MRTYTNGTKLQRKGKMASIGDPFVMRFNGKYYLYPSTAHDETGIHCFTSDNLVDWQYAGTVCDDPITKNAYAPEVIYAYDAFYLVTSPHGDGHYVFKADHPLGPFRRLRENIGQMIDGSFILDKGNRLYFSRAHHGGIALLEMDKDGRMHHRTDLHAPMHAWTEGPNILRRGTFYYMTYCGNHLESDGYRTDYGVADCVRGDYRRPPNNPLLIATHDAHKAIGHASIVEAPDLDGLYIIYHRLHKLKKGGHTRDLCLDRLYVSARFMSVTPTHFPVPVPKMPVFMSSDPTHDDQFFKQQGRRLSRRKTETRFTAEFNVADAAQLALIINDEGDSRYHSVHFEHDRFTFRSTEQTRPLAEGKLPVSMKPHRRIKIMCSEARVICELDGMPLFTSAIAFSGGHIGFMGRGTLKFTAFNNTINGAADLAIPLALPGDFPARLDRLHPTPECDARDDMHVVELTKGSRSELWVYSPSPQTYHLSCYGHVHDMTEIRIRSRLSDITLTLKPDESDYYDLTHHLGQLDIDGEDTVVIDVLKGRLSAKVYRIVRTALRSHTVHKGFVETATGLAPLQGQENYWLHDPEGDIERATVEFCLKAQDKYLDFSLLLHVDHYSEHPDQTDHSYVGVAVGFKGVLCLLDKVSYGRERVYDKPLPLEKDQWHTLSVHYAQSHYTVSINGRTVFSAIIPWSDNQGMWGLYNGPFSQVEFRNPKIERRGKP
ncbi:MAG: hypothetical protein EA374_00520 [Acholeplasmatales bacterium]|nr:MAG: hypothetical protein EA374_00520 [Acholeplasmatales bacterium]